MNYIVRLDNFNVQRYTFVVLERTLINVKGKCFLSLNIAICGLIQDNIEYCLFIISTGIREGKSIYLRTTFQKLNFPVQFNLSIFSLCLRIYIQVENPLTISIQGDFHLKLLW